jgi:hypothetical protein
MAADRHIGFRKNGIIRERIDQFSGNFTHTTKSNCFSEGLFIVCIIGNPGWLSTAILDFEKGLSFGNGLADSHAI